MKEFRYSDYTMNCYTIIRADIKTWDRVLLGEIRVRMNDGSVYFIPESYVNEFIEFMSEI